MFVHTEFFLVVISFQISFQASAVTFTSIQDQSAYIVQLRSCRMDNIMWLRQDLTVGTYSASLNILGGAVAILFVSLTLSLMMAIKACLKSVTSQLTEQNLQLREQRKLILKLIHRLEQGSLDVKETVISKEGVPSDHHQPQLHTIVKPEDAQRILVLSELHASLSSRFERASRKIVRSLSSDACETGTSPKWHAPQSPDPQWRHREDAVVGPLDEELSRTKNEVMRFSLPKLTRQKPASRFPKPHDVAAVTCTSSLASEKSTSKSPRLLGRNYSSGTRFDASKVQKRIKSAGGRSPGAPRVCMDTAGSPDVPRCLGISSQAGRSHFAHEQADSPVPQAHLHLLGNSGN